MAELDPTRASTTPVASISHEGETVVLRLAGELDISTLQDARRSADNLVEQQPERVVVELGQLTFMDSSGIALLLWIASKVPRVELRNPSPIIQQLIEMTGLNKTLPTTP